MGDRDFPSTTGLFSICLRWTGICDCGSCFVINCDPSASVVAGRATHRSDAAKESCNCADAHKYAAHKLCSSNEQNQNDVLRFTDYVCDLLARADSNEHSQPSWFSCCVRIWNCELPSARIQSRAVDVDYGWDCHVSCRVVDIHSFACRKKVATVQDNAN